MSEFFGFPSSNNLCRHDVPNLACINHLAAQFVPLTKSQVFKIMQPSHIILPFLII